MGSPKIINFAKATKKTILKELETAFENSPGCAPPEIPYTLFKRAIDSGLGEIASPFRMNRVVEDSRPDEKYIHSIIVYGISQVGINFRCYTDSPIDKNGNFIAPSQLPKEPCDWPKTTT